MKRNSTKVLSFLLVIMLMVNFMMQTTVFATDQQVPDEYIPSGSTVEESVEVFKEPKDPAELQQELDDLTYEIVSLRDENVKHFQLSDGTYQAVVYGEPVHRLNSSGEWEEIDNSLTEAGGAIVTGDSRVKFAKKITGNEPIYTHQYVAYMRSTRIGHNGPVKYRVGTTDYAATDIATIDATTGALTAQKVGTFKVGVTYSGAPWVWWWTVTIDRYISADLAAIGFMNEIYSSSRYILHEFGTKIYSTTSDGRTLYDYGTIATGSPHSVGYGSSTIPSDATWVATAHTHPNSNSFSSTDINNAINRGKNSYVTGPNLSVLKYSVSAGTTTSIGTASPVVLTQQQKADLVSQFQDPWNTHISYTTPRCPSGFDCKGRTWPNP